MLRKSQMMGVRGPPAANQTGLLGNEFDVVAVAEATRLGMGQHGSCRCPWPWMSTAVSGCRSSDEEALDRGYCRR